MRRLIVLSVFLLTFVFLYGESAFAQIEQMLGARFPSLSPNGERVIVSWNGDLWIAPSDGGEARRLTINTAYERNGVWSPDGKKVAFSSNRKGNYDIYTIPAEGGTPTQLTFSQANDYVSGWSKNGKILFYSFRGFRGFQLYETGETGGMPVTLTVDDCDTSYACYTPAGDVVYTRGTAEWYRKGYTGSSGFDLWFLDRKTLKSRRITDYKGNDGWPSTADGKTIFFASERDGVYNVYKVSVNGGTPVKVSNANEDGAAVPTIGANGSKIIYECAGRLYSVNPNGGGDKEIRITVASDEKENLVSKQIFGSAEEYKLSPNGKYIAFVVRGDVYVTYTDDAFPPGEKPDRDTTRAKRITNTPSREMCINWHPDSDKLVFVSDRNNWQQDIFTANLRNGELNRITDSPEDDSWPKYSSDGKRLLYNRAGNEIVLLNIETHDSRVVDKGEVMWGPWGGDFEFSPDGDWIGYSKSINGFNSEFFVVPTDGSAKPINIIKHHDWLGAGLWIPDGSGAVIMSNRQSDTWAIYRVDFKAKEKKFTDGFILDPPTVQPAPEPTAPAEGSEVAKEEKKLEIDFDRIWERVERLTYNSGHTVSPIVSRDSKWVYYFTEEGELWAVAIDGSEVLPMGYTSNGYDFQLSAAGDKLYFNSIHGGIGYLLLNGSQVVGSGMIPIYAETEVDRRKELVSMYSECWRLMKNYFYDPDLHGARKDWDAIYKKYLPLVEQTTTPEEFNYIVFDLLGDIRGSHLGVYGTSSFDGIPVYSGILGLEFDLSYEGAGLKVSHVLRDGPTDKKESKIEVGDVILSINGKLIDKTVDVDKYLDGKPGDQVDLNVQGRNSNSVVRVIAVDQNELYMLSYKEWVAEREAMTEKLSNGRVGYLHIAGMDWESFEKFQQDLFGVNFEKEAIIIDVRYNGGGWTHNYILDMLTRKAFGYARGRFAENFIGEPAMRWQKPAVCLINGSSYSDAEIFPYGFKQLGIGKVIGVPTHGSVIGTSEYSLVDGTGFRLPMEGWYTIDKRNMDVSGTRGIEGVQPDILVEHTPDNIRDGRDLQLERAVSELLKELSGRVKTP